MTYIRWPGYVRIQLAMYCLHMHYYFIGVYFAYCRHAYEKAVNPI